MFFTFWTKGNNLYTIKEKKAFYRTWHISSRVFFNQKTIFLEATAKKKKKKKSDLHLIYVQQNSQQEQWKIPVIVFKNRRQLIQLPSVSFRSPKKHSSHTSIHSLHPNTEPFITTLWLRPISQFLTHWTVHPSNPHLPSLERRMWWGTTSKALQKSR